MGGVFAGKNLRHVLESIRLHCDSVLRRLSPALRYRDNNVRITEDRPTPTKAGIWRLAVASLTGTLDSRRRQVRFCFQYFFLGASAKRAAAVLEVNVEIGNIARLYEADHLAEFSGCERGCILNSHCAAPFARREKISPSKVAESKPSTMPHSCMRSNIF